MKKYLALFAVFMLTLALLSNVVRAEGSDRDGNGGSDRGPRGGDEERRGGGGGGDKIREEMKLRFEEIQKKNELRKEDVKTKIEALKAKVGEEKDETKAKIKEARITGRENALERFDVALARMTGLKAKINTVVDKLSAKGVDTAGAVTLLATTDAKLSSITDKIAQIDSILTGSIDQLTPENKTKLRTLAQETQTLIKEVHATLIDAIKSLKDEVKAKIEKEQEDKTKTEDANGTGDNEHENDDAEDSQNQ